MQSLRIFKALADETRLRMLNLLLNNELNVNEIVALLKMGQSRISRHLKILTDSGLLSYRRDGLWVFYRATEKGKEFAGFIQKAVGTETEFENDARLLQEFLKDRNSESARFFDTVAEDWETMRQEIIGGADLEASLVAKIGQCGTAADLGCGNGNLIALLKPRAGKVIGVDHSPKMLETARRRFFRQSGRRIPHRRDGTSPAPGR